MDRVSSNTSCAGQGQGASVPAVQPSQWPQRTWSHQTYPVWGRGKGQAPVAPGWNPPRQSPRGWCGGVMRHGKSRREGGMQQKLGRKKRREETRGWVGREQQQEYGSMAVAGGRAGKCCPRNSSGPQHISATPSPPHLDRRGDGGVVHQHATVQQLPAEPEGLGAHKLDGHPVGKAVHLAQGHAPPLGQRLRHRVGACGRGAQLAVKFARAERAIAHGWMCLCFDGCNTEAGRAACRGPRGCAGGGIRGCEVWGRMRYSRQARQHRRPSAGRP